MALKDTWKDKVDGIDDVLASDINSIARSAIQSEEKIAEQETAINGKVDKVDAKRIVYGTGNNGEPVQRYISQTPSTNAVPQYSSDGRLQTNAPVEDLDCVNKKTMDDGLASKFSLPSKLDAWSILGIGDYNAETGKYKPQIYKRDPVGCVNAGVATFASVTDESRWDKKYQNLKYTLGVPDPIKPIQVANKRYVDNKVDLIKEDVELLKDRKSVV